MSGVNRGPFPEKKEITPNLKKIRESMQVTQRALSDQLDVTENTIANWENGRSIGKWLYQIKMLCQALDCTFEELIGEADKSDSGSFSDIKRQYQEAKENRTDCGE